MARRSSRRERDVNAIASRELDRLLTPVRPYRPVSLPAVSDVLPLSEVEDRRQFDFNPPVASARSLEGTPAVVVGPGGAAPRSASRVARGSQVASSPGFSFGDASRAVICVRRKQRREVLFAERRTRAGSGAKRRRRKAYSDVRC